MKIPKQPPEALAVGLSFGWCLGFLMALVVAVPVERILILIHSTAETISEDNDGNSNSN